MSAYNSVKVIRLNKLGNDNYIGKVIESSIDDIKVSHVVSYKLIDKLFMSIIDDQNNIDIIRSECIFDTN